MGRASGLNLSATYEPLDLYRYQANGIWQTGTGNPSYFSLNGGSTAIDSFNNAALGSGDLGDWAASAGNDAFLAAVSPGTINSLSQADINEMEALGWTTSNSAPEWQTISALSQVYASDTLQEGDPAVTALSNGGFIVAWDAYPLSNSAGRSVYDLAFNANGAIVGSATPNHPNIAGAMTAPDLATFSTDQSLMSFNLTFSTSPNTQLLNSSGVPSTYAWQGVGAQNIAEINGSTIAIFNAGEASGGTAQLDAQFLSSNLTASATMFVASIPGYTIQSVDAAAASSGTTVFVWEQHNGGNVNTDWFQFVSGTTVSGSPVEIGNAAYQAASGNVIGKIAVTSLQGGGFAVAYTDNSTWGSSNSNITLKIYSSSGVEIGQPVWINKGITADNIDPSITQMSDGTIAVGWTQDRGTNYYVSLLDTKGNVAAPTLTYSGGFGAITALANDRLAVVTTGAGNASGTKVEAAVLQHNPAVFSEETLSAITAQASTVVHGSNFNFSFNVQNVGTGPAPAGTAGIFVDQQTTQLTSISIGALAPGASMPINSAISTTNLIAGAHTLWVETNPGGSIAQGNSWSSVNFTVSPNISVPPTLAVTNVASATRGQVLPLSSVVTISDPSNFGYQKLELWDSNGTVAGGQFKINGVAQTGGHEIDVTSATFASTVFDAPTAGGTDTLWAQLQLNDGTLSGWKQFSVTVPMPTLSVSSVANATSGQVINLSTLVHVADPSSVGYQKLELWDSTGTAAGGQFKINGAAQTGGHEIDVTSVNVAGTVFDAPTAGGSDTLWAQLQLNDGTLSGWKQFSVTVPVPTLSVSSVANATAGQVINLSTLVHIADSGNVGYQKLELWDSNGTATGGQFKINGIAQSGGHEIDVTSVNVAGTVFDAPTAGGTDTLWAQLQLNDGTLSGWKQFSVTVPPPTLSVSGVASATAGQVINLSTLVNVADPSNVGYQKLELWDSNGTVAGGQFKINGIAQTGGHEIDVTSATFASTVFDAPSAGGTDTLWAQLVENDGTLSGWKQFSVTVPMPTLSVSTVANATVGQVINLSTLVNVADPSNVGYQKLELWDSNGTAAGGQFKINGISQTGGHEIDVTSATFAGTVFDAPTAGGTDTLWAQLQLNDGTLSGWKQFSVTVPPPTLVAHNYSTATPGQVIALSNLLTITDSSNVGYQKLELWDSNGTVATGQFVVNGAPQSGGHEIDVIPANVANTVFDEGTTGNTDTLWARLQQNDGTLTAWQQFTVVDPLDIAAGATLDLSSPYAGTVNFLGATGTLQLDHSSLFTGTVAGLIGADTIDLRDIGFAAQPLFSATGTGGILGITDGTSAASIQLLGDYAASSFVASSDGHGGTSIATVMGRLSA